MQAVNQQEPVTMSWDFDFEISPDGPNLFAEEPVPDLNVGFEITDPALDLDFDFAIPESEASVTPLEGGSADMFQNDTIDLLDSVTSPQSTTDEFEPPSSKGRKLSASRWVPCAPPPQLQHEASIWSPVTPYSNPVPSFAIPRQSPSLYSDPTKSALPYCYPSPYGTMPQHNFSAITPPGRQISSLPFSSHPLSNPVPVLEPPPPGRFGHVPPIANMVAPNDEDLVLSPNQEQQSKKRKRHSPTSRESGMNEDSDSVVFSGRRPPKKLGRPYQVKQTKEQRLRNKRRMENYHKRKHDPEYRAKCNQWTRESYRRKHGKGKGAEQDQHVIDRFISDSPIPSSPEYVFGTFGEQDRVENSARRRSTRLSKPRFPNLQF